jgi:ferredoxin-thioredoxin reductase catalytic subunit
LAVQQHATKQVLKLRMHKPMTNKSIEQLLEEQNRLLRESNEIERAMLENATAKKKPWVCACWPHCYHGAIVGGIFGCYGRS